MKQEKQQQQHKNYTLNRKLKTISSLCDVCVCVGIFVHVKTKTTTTTQQQKNHLICTYCADAISNMIIVHLYVYFVYTSEQ